MRIGVIFTQYKPGTHPVQARYALAAENAVSRERNARTAGQRVCGAKPTRAGLTVAKATLSPPPLLSMT